MERIDKRRGSDGREAPRHAESPPSRQHRGSSAHPSGKANAVDAACDRVSPATTPTTGGRQRALEMGAKGEEEDVGSAFDVPSERQALKVRCISERVM